MNVKKAIKRTLLRLLGEDPDALAAWKAWGKPCYEGDYMRLYGRDMSWLTDPDFQRAYEAGVNTGHKFGKYGRTQEWRMHINLWAAHHATKIEGDFVECGVNTGILSVAVCEYLNFAKLTDRNFWLFDTYNGIPESQMSEDELERRRKDNQTWYEDCYELAKKNFSPYPNAHLVRGLVPDTLSTVPIQKVAYLALDMNIALPERAAIEYFWEKLTPGAFVILDDYGFEGSGPQHETMDEFAASRGIKIASLPTGQGLIIKP